VRELRAIPGKRDRQRIVRRIQALEDDPRPPGSQKLSGRERYRIRQGQYRIVYGIEKNELVVYVIKIGHRKDVYRDL
jgi:mRNA interferase RelE/StbE